MNGFDRQLVIWFSRKKWTVKMWQNCLELADSEFQGPSIDLKKPASIRIEVDKAEKGQQEMKSRLNKSKSFLKSTTTPKDEWPAASPDLNVLDYCIWSIIESEVNAEAHSSVESLKEAIETAFENLNQQTINRAVDNWMKRLDKVIEANGGHFE